MPVSARQQQSNTPDRLRPYIFHGLDLSIRGTHAVGDCPFCNREGKFSVEVETGLWRCFVCAGGTVSGGGNGLSFTRLLYENSLVALESPRIASAASNSPNGGIGQSGRNNASQSIVGDSRAFLATVASDRRLLSPDTVRAWGVSRNGGGTWLVPGYGTDGKLDQVYRRVKMQENSEWKWKLLPTPGIWPEGKVHALHLPASAQDFDPTRPNLIICEGPWDGMALWEVWNREDKTTNILAVPGCNVWRDDWTALCKGKCVTLLFDSDHPRANGKITSKAGYDGMKRVATKLSGIAASVRIVMWGEGGFDSSKPSGWDVRDELSSVEGTDRSPTLANLFFKVQDAPRDWFNPASQIINGTPQHVASVESRPCHTWAECEGAWKNAMRWRQDLSDFLALGLAVCASTHQGGNQLFLDIIGSPGSAKTTICKGFLVSGHCIHLENITKLISGWKLPEDRNQDCSFLARANGKTWITCEFDTLGSSPQYRELMGKVRRIFDGETSATYANDNKDIIYTALRTPWIRAGTMRMMDHDQSQLGDRFMRFIIDDPGNGERREIARSALQSERAAMLDRTNNTAGSLVDPKTRLAHALTGGYVDWLRANVEELLPQVDVPVEVDEYCIDLAELSADMRARPNDDKRRTETYDSKELPTRLARQNIRTACFLAIAMNKKAVDADVLRILRKLALDTAFGHSLNIARWLCSPNPKMNGKLYQECGGLMAPTLEMWSGMTPERLQKYLMFLRKMDILKWEQVRTQTSGSWMLTDRVYELYLRVVRG